MHTHTHRLPLSACTHRLCHRVRFSTTRFVPPDSIIEYFFSQASTTSNTTSSIDFFCDENQNQCVNSHPEVPLKRLNFVHTRCKEEGPVLKPENDLTNSPLADEQTEEVMMATSPKSAHSVNPLSIRGDLRALLAMDSLDQDTLWGSHLTTHAKPKEKRAVLTTVKRRFSAGVVNGLFSLTTKKNSDDHRPTKTARRWSRRWSTAGLATGIAARARKKSPRRHARKADRPEANSMGARSTNLGARPGPVPRKLARMMILKRKRNSNYQIFHDVKVPTAQPREPWAKLCLYSMVRHRLCAKTYTRACMCECLSLVLLQFFASEFASPVTTISTPMPIHTHSLSFATVRWMCARRYGA